MTNLTNPTEHDLEKWRAQANKAAKHIKAGDARMAPRPGETDLFMGFAFDEPTSRWGSRIITVRIAPARIEAMTEQELADFIHDDVLRQVRQA